MKKFESIDEVAQALGDGGPFNPDVEYGTIEEVVDALVELGNTDKVYAYHDDHLGLKERLSKEFLKTPLTDSDNPKFEAEIQAVLEQANQIIQLSVRELSEDDLDDIREDKISRGEDPDD